MTYWKVETDKFDAYVMAEDILRAENRLTEFYEDEIRPKYGQVKFFLEETSPGEYWNNARRPTNHTTYILRG